MNIQTNNITYFETDKITLIVPLRVVWLTEYKFLRNIVNYLASSMRR